VPVEAVGGDVEDAIVEPADMDLARIIDVLDLGEWLDPVDAAPMLGPEPLGACDRFGIQFFGVAKVCCLHSRVLLDNVRIARSRR